MPARLAPYDQDEAGQVGSPRESLQPRIRIGPLELRDIGSGDAWALTDFGEGEVARLPFPAA
ncbi:MAG TPA: hypothetical protein VF171_05930, partial [Trueperaceae bacterium]